MSFYLQALLHVQVEEVPCAEEELEFLFDLALDLASSPCVGAHGLQQQETGLNH